MTTSIKAGNTEYIRLSTNKQPACSLDYNLLRLIQNMKRKDDIRIVITIPRSRLKEAGRQRWKGVEKKERSRILSAAGKASWANLTPEERSVEMKRRARTRTRNKAKARKTPAPPSR
jgi:hypothetical protein